MQKSTERYFPFLICFLIAISTGLVFWQVHEFEFVDFDDTTYVLKNPDIRQAVTFESIAWAVTTVHAANWHPLTWLSHMLDVALFGLDAGKHHLVNLLFHITNSLLLFLVLRKMTGALWQSALVAALFALHPLHVESVAWVSERKDVLSTFFWMLTLGAYAVYVARPSVLKYLGVLLLLSLGLMSKPMLVTLPCVLLLLDYWPLKRFSFQACPGDSFPQNQSVFKLIGEKIPLFILAAISSALTYYAQNHGGAVKSLDYIPFADRVANALVSYVLYIGKMICPVDLACLYPHPETLPWWQVLGAILVLISVSGMALREAKTRPYLMVGWLWYLGTLVPVIGLVQVGGQAMADRYTYVPLIGLFVMMAWGMPEFLKSWRFRKIFLLIFSVVVLLILSGITWKQAGYWKDSLTLFEHAVKVTENNSGMHYNLGNALADQQRDSEAIVHYLAAIRIEPDFADAHNNLANVYRRQGDGEAAIRHYLKVLEMRPDDDGVNYNLGMTLDDQGRTREAIAHYLSALKGMAENPDAHFKTANALFKTGAIDDAVQHYRRAIELKPDFVDAHCNLGVVLFQSGDMAGAVAAFKAALRLKPDYPPARQYLQKALSVKLKK